MNQPLFNARVEWSPNEIPRRAFRPQCTLTLTASGQVVGVSTRKIIDHSGSMRGEKIAAVRNGIINMLKSRLPDDTEIGIIIFDDNMSWIVEPAKLSVCRAEAIRQVGLVEDNGYTHLSPPFKAAVQSLQEYGVVVYFTDGQSQSSSGEPYPDDVTGCRDACKMFRDKNGTLFALGCGMNYEYDVLGDWVERVGGQSVQFHLKDAAAIHQFFQQIGNFFAGVVAKNVELRFIGKDGMTFNLINRQNPVAPVPLIKNTLAVDRVGLLPQSLEYVVVADSNPAKSLPLGNWNCMDVEIEYDDNKGNRQTQVVPCDIILADDAGQMNMSVVSAVYKSRASVAMKQGQTAAASQYAKSVTQATGSKAFEDMLLTAIGQEDTDATRTAKSTILSGSAPLAPIGGN